MTVEIEAAVSVWLLIFLSGAVTFATRAPRSSSCWTACACPIWFWRALRFVPVAVLSAIILPETVSRNGVTDLSLAQSADLGGAS